jgi:1-acyl-sn-glycerol-3-phosphate acyltransferase
METGLERRIEKLHENFNLTETNTVGMERLGRVRFDRARANQERHILRLNLVYRLINEEYQGMENIPKAGPFVIAMNHTSAFDSAPFQCQLYNWFKLFEGKPKYTTSWVKGEHMKFGFVDRFYEDVGFIPVLSKTYFLNQLYRNGFGKDPRKFEGLKTIKKVLNGNMNLADARKEHSEPDTKAEVGAFLDRIDLIGDYHERLVARSGELTYKALENGLKPIIFPSGTRSKRLGNGRPGLAQFALHSNVPIIPVGCSGHVYHLGLVPIPTPFAKTKFVIGEPVDLRQFTIPERFALFSKESQIEHADKFEGANKAIMMAINELLDTTYQNNALYGVKD